MATNILSSINENDLIVHVTKESSIEHIVIAITGAKSAPVKNTKTGQLKTIKFYQGSWKMKGGLLQKNN